MALYEINIQNKGLIQVRTGSDNSELNESHISFFLKGHGIHGNFDDDQTKLIDTISRIKNILKIQELLTFILVAWGMNYFEFLMENGDFEWTSIST